MLTKLKCTCSYCNNSNHEPERINFFDLIFSIPCQVFKIVISESIPAYYKLNILVQ